MQIKLIVKQIMADLKKIGTSPFREVFLTPNTRELSFPVKS